MKFQDEKTQELFEDLIEQRDEYVREVYSGSPAREERTCYYDTENAFIAHVESRLNREQEPCEWEKKNTGEETGTKYWCIRDAAELIPIPNFCPICGRKLEAK